MGLIGGSYVEHTNITINHNYTLAVIFARTDRSGGVLQQVQYEWDENGNLSTRYDVVTDEKEFFVYDSLDRLLNVFTAPNVYSEMYTYNTIGNIMSRTRDGVEFTYDYRTDHVRPHAVEYVSSSGNSTDYAYDANGNMVTRGDQTLAWDAENRLISVSVNGTPIAQYVYDGDGNRVKKWESNETVVYINQYYEVNLTTANATSYYYLGGKLIASLEKAPGENGTLRYTHQDHLTSTSLMTDANGYQIGSTVKYLPFGEARAAIDIPTDKLFTGQRLDSTGLYYYNARYYDPTLGRFISPDTIVQSPAIPQILNRYSYSLNNPLKYIDPSGHIVQIRGLDVKTIDEGMHCPYLPQECKDLITDLKATEEYQAYDDIRNADSTFTNELEASDIIFNIRVGDLGAPTYNPDGSMGYTGAQTQYREDLGPGLSSGKIVDITLNNNPLLPDNRTDHSARVRDLSHEIIHAYGITLDPYDKVTNSRFEENLADQYSKFICDKLNISYEKTLPTSAWYGVYNTRDDVAQSFPSPNLVQGGTYSDSIKYLIDLYTGVGVYLNH